MSRTVPAALVAALQKKNIQPFYAVQMDFDNGTVALWTGSGERVIDGQSFIGTGALMGVDGMDEVADLTATGATATLSAIASSILSIALQEPYQGRPARILFGEASVPEFTEVFAGDMDVMTIEDSGDTSSISLTLESKLIQLQRSNVRRYTSENHKLRYPNDTFFDFVTDIADKEIFWGRNATN